MQELTAIQYTDTIKAGTTFPHKFKAETNDIYACKFYDACSHNKHLINEYVCYTISKALGLPIPDGNLIRVPSELMPSEEILAKRNEKIHSDLAFGSKWLTKSIPKVSPVHLERCTNTEDIPKIILFDQLILNNDRACNDGNLLIDITEKKLYIIDHSHVFLTGLLWNEHTLEQDKDVLLVPSFTKKNNHMLLQYVNGHDPFNGFIELLKNTLTPAFIQEIISNVPDEWNISVVEKTALEKFLNHRVSLCDKIVEAIKDNWPYWKGV